MKKKKQKKSQIMPMLAIGVGIILLLSSKQKVVVKVPTTKTPQLPSKVPASTMESTIGVRPNRSRYLPTSI